MMSSVARLDEARESLLLLQVQKALLLPHAVTSVHQRQRSSSSRLIKEVAPIVRAAVTCQSWTAVMMTLTVTVTVTEFQFHDTHMQTAR